jgi:hypothetical protein
VLLLKKGGKSCVFVTQQKYKYSHQFERLIVPVVGIKTQYSGSTLLYILGCPSCVGAVSHGLVVYEIYLIPDLYAFDVSKKQYSGPHKETGCRSPGNFLLYVAKYQFQHERNPFSKGLSNYRWISLFCVSTKIE